MTADTLTVFTFKSIDTCLKVGGTQSWRLKPETARQCRYVVLCRNARHIDVEGNEPHRSAFMIGRISGIEPSTNHEGRWRVMFDSYAEIDIPEAYKGGRNSIHYTTLAELGIDPSKLDFKTYTYSPESKKEANEEGSGTPANGGLTVVQARTGLAITFGVKPESIEILIHA